MKIAEYQQMMDYLTGPRESFRNGGRIGFSKGGSAALVKILNELPDGTEVTRDMVQKIIDDNNLDITVRNFFAKPSKSLKEGITLSKRMSPVKITDALLESVDNYIKNTPLDLKQIGEDIGYKETEKGKSGGLRKTSPLIKAYEEKYGKIPDGRFKPYKLTKGSDYVQNIIKLREELKSTNAVAKQLKLDSKTIRNVLSQFRPDLMGEVNVPGPNTGPKAAKKRAKEIIKEGEKKAGPNTTKQAKEVIQGIADRNKIYANMSAEELAKDKNFLRRLRLKINPNSGAVDFTGYTEANPVRGKVFNDVELAQHAINKAKEGKLIAHDHITPKKFRKQNIGYPINFQPTTYMENSQFENARSYLTNNPSGNVDPINSYLKSNNKTIRFGKNKYGYTGNIVYNSKTGNQTLLDFEKRINVGGRRPVASKFGKSGKLGFAIAAPYIAATKGPEFLNTISKNIFTPLDAAEVLPGEAKAATPKPMEFDLNMTLPKPKPKPKEDIDSGSTLFDKAVYGALPLTLTKGLRSFLMRKYLPAAVSPTALGAYTVDQGGYDLSKPMDRVSLGAEAAFAPSLVKGTLSATKGIKNKALRRATQQALNLGVPARLAMRAARIANPIGIASLVGEGLYGYGKFVKSELDRIKAMTPEEREAYNVEQQEQMSVSAAGGGLLKQAGDRSGKPPEAGPTPQGLDFLIKRGRQY
tara:strand:- start:227 stop:2314 length:2088 start_codon:yes stop_codon:yes gene_type:complete